MRALDAFETALRRVSPLFEEVSSLTMMTFFLHLADFSEAERKRLGSVVFALTHEKEKLLDGINAMRLSLNENNPMVRRSTKALNIEAIRIVEGAVGVWSAYQDSPPPKRALNPATKFGKFLGDLFEACHISGDPKSAFRAWAQTYGADCEY